MAVVAPDHEMEEEQEVWLVQLDSEKIGCALLGCMLGSASSHRCPSSLPRHVPVSSSVDLGFGVRADLGVGAMHMWGNRKKKHFRCWPKFVRSHLLIKD